MTTDRLEQSAGHQLGRRRRLGNVRNPLQAITLIPGTHFADDNTLRVNGMPSSTQSIRIEGQDATNGIARQIQPGNQAGLDAIQEVSVQTSNFAAEYGQAGGGYFNYTMKSGTNQFHGSAYDYFVNEVLNAGTPFTDAARTAGNGQHIRNAQRRNDYGFTVGGPIAIPKVYDGHDKTFLLLQLRAVPRDAASRRPASHGSHAAYRQGNFSAALIWDR